MINAFVKEIDGEIRITILSDGEFVAASNFDELEQKIKRIAISKGNKEVFFDIREKEEKKWKT